MDNRPQFCKAVFAKKSIKNDCCLPCIYQELFLEARNYWAAPRKTAPSLSRPAVIKICAEIFSVDKPIDLF